MLTDSSIYTSFLTKLHMQVFMANEFALAWAIALARNAHTFLSLGEQVNLSILWAVSNCVLPSLDFLQAQFKFIYWHVGPQNWSCNETGGGGDWVPYDLLTSKLK